MTNVSQDDIRAIRSSGLFDEKWYLDTYPDVKALGMDPIEHYLWIGARLKRNPSKNFDAKSYLHLNDDVASAGVNPLLHYAKFGREEGRSVGKRPVAERPPAGDARLPFAGFSQHGTGAPERQTFAPPPPPAATQLTPADLKRQMIADMNSSTYNTKTLYDFASAAHIELTAKTYLANAGSKNDIAVFSAVSGGYDSLLYHEHLMSNADYYYFTDPEQQEKYIYRMRRAPYFEDDQVRIARFVKSHPHMLLAGYRIAIWVDGNILIRRDISHLIRAFEQSGLPVAAVPHPLRYSVYEEAAECIKRGKDDSTAIEAQMARFRAEGFESDELVESNFLMFRLDHPRTAEFLNAWWTEQEKGSRRDQLSFNYAMRKAGTSYYPLTEKPNSVRNHPDLALFHHGTNPSPHVGHYGPPSSSGKSYHDVLEERVAAQKDRTADVVVCVYNALDWVKICLESVDSSRNPAKHRIVIVNDGSDAETTEWLALFAHTRSNVHLISHAQAGGYTRAANAGLRAMNSDLAIMLNSDTIVAGRWIEKLLDAAFSNPGVGIVGPLSSAASSQSIPEHRSTANQTAVNDLPDGYTVADMNTWCERNSPADFTPRLPLVHGFCFAITREAAKKIGGFDEENFPRGYGEENDYCFRAVNAGFSLAVATHTYVYHEKSQSYQDGDKRTALMKGGNMKIRELHGKERVLRAVRTMQTNPHLQRMRELANGLFIDSSSGSK